MLEPTQELQSSPEPEDEQSASTLAFTAFTAGDFHSCGLRDSHTITCWGSNEYGQTDPPA